MGLCVALCMLDRYCHCWCGESSAALMHAWGMVLQVLNADVESPSTVVRCFKGTHA